jgi:uncharacterized lipoprotein YajG
MKNMLSSLLMVMVVAFSFSAFSEEDIDWSLQDTISTVILSFEESEDVQELIVQAEENELVVAEEVDLALLQGSCGFAGCSATYLVTQATKTPGTVNAQTSVIAATVKVFVGSDQGWVNVVTEDQLAGLFRPAPRPGNDEEE